MHTTTVCFSPNTAPSPDHPAHPTPQFSAPHHLNTAPLQIIQRNALCNHLPPLLTARHLFRNTKSKPPGSMTQSCLSPVASCTPHLNCFNCSATFCLVVFFSGNISLCKTLIGLYLRNSTLKGVLPFYHDSGFPDAVLKLTMYDAINEAHHSFQIAQYYFCLSAHNIHVSIIHGKNGRP